MQWTFARAISSMRNEQLVFLVDEGECKAHFTTMLADQTHHFVLLRLLGWRKGVLAESFA